MWKIVAVVAGVLIFFAGIHYLLRAWGFDIHFHWPSTGRF